MVKKNVLEKCILKMKLTEMKVNRSNGKGERKSREERYRIDGRV